MTPKYCAQCDKEFKPKPWNRKVCSWTCAKARFKARGEHYDQLARARHGRK